MPRFFCKKLFLSCITGLLVGCAIGPSKGIYIGSQTDKCGLVVNPSIGIGLRWDRDKFPIPFYIHESVPVPAHKNFISALENWNLAWEDYLLENGITDSFPLFHVPNPRAQYAGSPKNDSHNMLFFLDNYNKHKRTTEQAVTSLFYDTEGNLSDADILVNNTGEFTFFYDENYNKDVIAFKQKKAESARRLASSTAQGSFSRLLIKIQTHLEFFLKLFKKQAALRKIAQTTDRIPINSVDFPSLMIHEAKHAISGQHCKATKLSGRCFPADAKFEQRMAEKSWEEQNEDYYSVMEPRLSNGRSRRDITDHDLEKLFCGYINL